MKVKVEEVISYKVMSEDGTVVGVFNKDSEWHGMIHITNGSETMIITEKPPSLFPNGIFNDQAASWEAQLVNFSIGLKPKLMPTPQPPDRPPEAGSPESPGPHC